MKFGHNFQRALENEMPPGWSEAAIQYKALKKCIKRFVYELSSLGLSAETIRRLISSSDENQQRAITMTYSLAKEGHVVVPKIVVNVNFEKLKDDEFAASMVKQLSASSNIANSFHTPTSRTFHINEKGGNDNHCSNIKVGQINTYTDDSEVQQMELLLNFDHEFFEKLTTELQNVEHLQQQQREILHSAFENLTHDISLTASPVSKKHYNSLYCWRTIFRLYMDADIFMSSKEADGNRERSPELAQRHLSWFDQQVRKAHCLPSSTKHHDWVFYNQFVELNRNLLKMTFFQSMNKLAVTKILKKFDKRTSLTAQPLFFKVIDSDPLLVADNVAKAICFNLNSKLFSVIPQLQDFECAICSNIAYKPVRLGCSHVFCLHCLIILQRQKVNLCPLCRAEEVLKADSRNIDQALLNFMKTFFPREIKQKRVENEEDLFTGPSTSVRVISDKNACIIM
ncbi:ubiquitin-protein ligase E3 [Schizosaccharomyces cryophilus OY26]|uniref:Ubiquitin-protein ligase E3 n=1 Tax=Schizosaccharomyces cryophilus (strain OY26 / ATCC MYA-4695 / CBS 11777 / NBRC 106824 / NRRL Y48691) TaxID=653667 RepID=S9W0F0_SCHCR|nr:ubiquitin-protein ligase E3 [Schizosaccharomyces cryophilus OY26]EPY51874.1 ubiquitin-protein ligase E3 [Schizosaccharomyces cryophilus OY26]